MHTKKWRKLRNIVLLVLCFSLMQYASTGSVSWPEDLFRHVTESLKDYATRPDASWRRATEKLEEISAAREGKRVPEFDLTGRVVRVADGDTVSILDKTNTQHKIRLFGIDTPEQNQPYGKAAKRALSHWVEDKQVGVVVVETDSYGRQVGTLYREDNNINVAMVSGGHAWWYRYYAPHEQSLAAAERKARQQGLGLWSDHAPVPPWDWRKGQR